MRRVVPILLALILVPSLAMASWYRCELDGATRAACCCPSGAGAHKDKAPSQDASLEAACCCTVVQVASVEPGVRDHPPASIDGVAPPVLAIEPALDPSLDPAPRVALPSAIDRPRALGDPPDTLFARRCSLLL